MSALEIGQKIGRLTVLEDLGTDKGGHRHHRCKCECGRERRVQTAKLKMRAVVSCGCFKRERHNVWSQSVFRKREETPGEE